jgi:hypothetical protein
VGEDSVIEGTVVCGQFEELVTGEGLDWFIGGKPLNCCNEGLMAVWVQGMWSYLEDFLRSFRRIYQKKRRRRVRLSNPAKTPMRISCMEAEPVDDVWLEPVPINADDEVGDESADADV